jgi:nitrogen fixation/metabolism regulation signal transduction histidine kinase
VSNPENLFIPFYTTKPKGSGIGLVLCRQIIDAHGGHLMLTNRENKEGCIASIELAV